MKTRSTLRALLVAGALMAMSAPAMAQRYYDSGNDTRWSVSINLGNHPQWRPIQGTRVYEMHGARPGYDAFRYGRNYYVYDNDRWYRSNRPNGRFAWIDDRSVPRDFRNISRDHWRDVSWHDRWDRDR